MKNYNQPDNDLSARGNQFDRPSMTAQDIKVDNEDNDDGFDDFNSAPI